MNKRGVNRMVKGAMIALYVALGVVLRPSASGGGDVGGGGPDPAAGVLPHGHLEG